jgi:transposase
MLPASVRILVCTSAQDLRRSFDGLALVARELLGEDPQSGAIFCFDRSGYCLLYKRMHGARVAWPLGTASGKGGRTIDAAALHALLAGVPHAQKERKAARKRLISA